MDIEEVKKIVLQDGDVLAIKLPKDSETFKIKRAKDRLTEMFPKKQNSYLHRRY